MEWLVDFMLTRCNFWRSASKREKRNKEERVRRQLWRIRRTRNADEYVSGMCKREKKGGRAPYEEYPTRARNLFVGRPQTMRRLRNRLTSKRHAVKMWNRCNELAKNGRKCRLGADCEKKNLFSPLDKGRKLREFEIFKTIREGLRLKKSEKTAIGGKSWGIERSMYVKEILVHSCNRH